MFNNELEALEALYNMFIQQNENINLDINNLISELYGHTNYFDNIYMRILMPVYILLGIWFMTWLLFKIFKG